MNVGFDQLLHNDLNQFGEKLILIPHEHQH